MSIADHFEHKADAGFIRAYDARAARRQFRVSVILVVVLALAAGVLGVVFHFEGPAAAERPRLVKTSHLHVTGTLPDLRS